MAIDRAHLPLLRWRSRPAPTMTFTPKSTEAPVICDGCLPTLGRRHLSVIHLANLGTGGKAAPKDLSPLA